MLQTLSDFLISPAMAQAAGERILELVHAQPEIRDSDAVRL